MFRKFVLSLIFVVSVAAAQQLGIGVKVGVPATDAFNSSPFLSDPFLGRGPGGGIPVDGVTQGYEAHRYTVGPYLELRLPGAIALELDALYRTYDFGPTAAHSWEFPLLVKHRILPGPVKPFFEG